jgi:hypothetical protein
VHPREQLAYRGRQLRWIDRLVLLRHADARGELPERGVGALALQRGVDVGEEGRVVGGVGQDGEHRRLVSDDQPYPVRVPAE